MNKIFTAMEGLDDGLLTMAMTKPTRAGSALWMRGLAIAASAAVVISGGGFVALRYLRGGNAAVKSNGTEPSYSYHPTTSEYFDPGYSGFGNPATFDDVFGLFADLVKIKFDEFWEEYVPDEDGNPDLEYGKVLFARATILEDYGQDAYNVLFRRWEHLKGEGDTEEDMAKDYPWLAEAYEEFKNGKIIFWIVNKSSNEHNLEHNIDSQTIIDYLSSQDYFIVPIKEYYPTNIIIETTKPIDWDNPGYRWFAYQTLSICYWDKLIPFSDGKLTINEQIEFCRKNNIRFTLPKDEYITKEVKNYFIDGVDIGIIEERLRKVSYFNIDE